MTDIKELNSISIETIGLTRCFGEFRAVDDLSLSIRSGEIFGFLGPNGAGKTTSINMICGLLKPDRGKTLIFGRPVSGDDPQTKARVGVCPQQIVIWPRLTCLEQLEFMGEMYDLPRAIVSRRAKVLLERIGLADKIGKLADTLSGGMQRRLSIALALIHEPDIVVLDEPEAGLDPQSRVLVREYIVELARQQKKTVIFTTHNMDEAERIVDRVAIIDRGKLLVLDTPTNLIHRIGKGDTLELELGGEGNRLPPMLATKLTERFKTCDIHENILVLRELAIIERIPAIIEELKGLGCLIRRIHLRESTLEDVFIALTGRRLRE